MKTALVQIFSYFNRCLIPLCTQHGHWRASSSFMAQRKTPQTGACPEVSHIQLGDCKGWRGTEQGQEMSRRARIKQVVHWSIVSTYIYIYTYNLNIHIYRHIYMYMHINQNVHCLATSGWAKGTKQWRSHNTSPRPKPLLNQERPQNVPANLSKSYFCE